jgi:hypothetical protein
LLAFPPGICKIKIDSKNREDASAEGDERAEELLLPGGMRRKRIG